MTTSYDQYQTIGKSLLRTDALAKVTGAAVYPADLALENALHMATLFATARMRAWSPSTQPREAARVS